MDEIKRLNGKRRRRSVIYIICEGTKTEVNYFLKFRTRFSNIDIRPFASQHKSSHLLVEHARDTIRHEPYYPADGDQIWCVFDCDDNSNEELLKAEQLAQSYQYHIAFSNPAFELWFLLHFTDQRGFLENCDAVIKKLNSGNFIKDYDKSQDYFSLLQPRQRDAIQRAKTLIERHTSDGRRLLHRDSNPCTSVVQLVEVLHEHAQKG